MFINYCKQILINWCMWSNLSHRPGLKINPLTLYLFLRRNIVKYRVNKRKNQFRPIIQPQSRLFYPVIYIEIEEEHLVINDK